MTLRQTWAVCGSINSSSTPVPVMARPFTPPPARPTTTVPAINDFQPCMVLHRRQIYRSLDGGENWQPLSGLGFPGMPEYADVLTMAVSPTSGRVYVQEWTGQ